MQLVGLEIVGVGEPEDEKSLQLHLNVVGACNAAGVSIPQKTMRYLNINEEDDESYEEIVARMKRSEIKVRAFQEGDKHGYEFDVSYIPKRAKTIKIYQLMEARR